MLCSRSLVKDADSDMEIGVRLPIMTMDQQQYQTSQYKGEKHKAYKKPFNHYGPRQALGAQGQKIKTKWKKEGNKFWMVF